MDRDEILAMRAGRELDELVGKHVMGLDIVEDRLLPQLPKHYLPEYERTIFTDVPLYSSDISAAWEVVEKLQPTLWVRMNSMLGDHYCGVGSPDMRWEHRSKSMPEAICKAALLTTIGADKP